MGALPRGAKQPHSGAEDRRESQTGAQTRPGPDSAQRGPGTIESAAWASGGGRLEELVHRAVARLPAFRGTELLFEANRAKYAAQGPESGADHLDEVFEVMRDLNAGALADPTLGADAEGRDSFRDQLSGAVDDLVATLEGRPITYVEFGPEPTKTHDILGRLSSAGVSVVRYIAVDINPASGPRMREALADLLPRDRIEVVNQPFDQVAPETLHVPGATTVLTTLGFQEGNDHPEDVTETLSRLLRPGDLVLSEMQVADRGDDTAFHAFYNTALMRRFSRLCAERALPGTASSFRLAVTDVDCGLAHPIRVCAMCEDLPADAEGRPRSFITNICLKPTSQQWREMRARGGWFKVLSQRLTGDRSVAFQLAWRTPGTRGTSTRADRERGGG